MSNNARTAVASLAAVVLAAASITPVVAQESGEEYEEVVFRVSLQGPVDPSHTFAVRRQCSEQICATEDIVIVCSPPSKFYDYDPCAATTYEFTTLIEAGLTVEYALLRWTSPDLRHTHDQPEEHLEGSFVVRQGRQVISLGYDYGRQTNAPALPDTAIASP